MQMPMKNKNGQIHFNLGPTNKWEKNTRSLNLRELLG